MVMTTGREMVDELMQLLAQPHGRQVVRWQMIRADMPEDLSGKTLVDLGCNIGDDVRRAADEGMRAIGVDRPDAIQAARRTRDNRRGIAIFTADDLFEWPRRSGRYDFGLCLSVFPYLVEQRGRADAEHWLRFMLAHVGALYFETQLDGDGPGPHWLPDDAAVAALLRNCGAIDVRIVTTLPVYGRDAWRTTWVASTGMLASRIAVLPE